MKLIFLLLIFSSLASATICKVDGISDGPQKMSCIIKMGSKMEKIRLQCKSSHYEFIWNNKSYPVDIAYHEEVESGSSPLVFCSGAMRLTAIIDNSSTSAELEVNGRFYRGICEL